MPDTPTFRLLQEVILSIEQNLPDATSWPELRDLTELIPVDPSVLDSPLPDTVRGPVAMLLEKAETQAGVVLRMPIPRPFFGPCQLLARWVQS
jgi:hypothetical protein